MINSSNLINSLEIYTLSNPDDVKPHWVSHFIVPTANELLIKIKNKNGNSGFGCNNWETPGAGLQFGAAIKHLRNGRREILKTFKHYRTFTKSNPNKPVVTKPAGHNIFCLTNNINDPYSFATNSFTSLDIVPWY